MFTGDYTAKDFSRSIAEKGLSFEHGGEKTMMGSLMFSGSIKSCFKGGHRTLGRSLIL
jgi:hypothetical protein